jgi:hypothetical protein
MHRHHVSLAVGCAGSTPYRAVQWLELCAMLLRRKGRLPTGTVSILDGDSLPGLLPQPPPFSHNSESKAPWVEQGYLRQSLAGSIVSPGHPGTSHGIVALAVSLERDPAVGRSTQEPKAQDGSTVAWRAYEAIRRPAIVSGSAAVLRCMVLGSDGLLCCARGRRGSTLCAAWSATHTNHIPDQPDCQVCVF